MDDAFCIFMILNNSQEKLLKIVIYNNIVVKWMMDEALDLIEVMSIFFIYYI